MNGELQKELARPEEIPRWCPFCGAMLHHASSPDATKLVIYCPAGSLRLGNIHEFKRVIKNPDHLEEEANR